MITEDRTVKAWPFVVARNRTLDWRPIAAPDFLVRDERQYVLLRTMIPDVAEDLAAWSSPAHIVDDAQLGTMTVVSRTRLMTRAELGDDGNDPLIDSSGRDISVVEGLVVRGRYPDLATQLSGPSPATTASTNDYFRSFWTVDDEAWRAPGTESFILPVSLTRAVHGSAETAALAAARPTGRYFRVETIAGASVVLLAVAVLTRRIVDNCLRLTNFLRARQ